MPRDLTVILQNRPGTIADVGEALGKAGVNISGLCGFPCGDEGILHVLVDDSGAARSALGEAGYEVRDERDVVVLDVANRPGALGDLTRQIADAGVNVDLIYVTADGQLVMSGGDVDAIGNAAGS